MRKILFCLLLTIVLALTACSDAGNTDSDPADVPETENDSEAASDHETSTETEPDVPENSVREERDGAILTLSGEKSSAVLYEAPDDSFLSDAYGAELSLDGELWYPLDVWTARVAVQVRANEYEIYTTYFVNFDMEGEVLLRVTPKAAGNVLVRPDGRVWRSEENGAHILRIPEPTQLSFEVGGDIYGNLQIFANPRETVDRNDPDIIYFAPGVYTMDNCDLIEAVPTWVGEEKFDTPTLYVPSGKTLYLAGGAVIRATVIIENCQNSGIAGRGVIDLLPWNRDDNIRASSNEPSPYGIRIVGSTDTTVSGVTVRDAMAYSIYAGNSTGIEVDNFKAIAAAQWSDGFDAMSTSQVVIKNSFFRTNDDCIAIYGSRWSNKGSSRGYEITDCILWADNAHAVNIGNHGSNNASAPDYIEDIVFRNIDILEVHSVNHTGAFRIACGGETIVRDITLENIDAEFSQSDLIRLHFVADGGYLGGGIENITFRDIECVTENAGIYLEGNSGERAIGNITFDDVWIGNERIDADSAKLHKNSYVTGISFGDGA